MPTNPRSAWSQVTHNQGFLPKYDVWDFKARYTAHPARHYLRQLVDDIQASRGFAVQQLLIFALVSVDPPRHFSDA